MDNDKENRIVNLVNNVLNKTLCGICGGSCINDVCEYCGSLNNEYMDDATSELVKYVLDNSE